MSDSVCPLKEAQVLTGPLFNEPMRIETVRESGNGTWTVGLVGIQTERFRKVTLSAHDLDGISILEPGFHYDGDGRLLRLGLQAYSLGIAWEFDLGELLRDTSDHFLLLTATPHKGDPENFTLFLQLLDADAYADVRSIQQAMNRQRAPFYLRRTKEAMVYFPERRDDRSWAAQKIFTKRIPHTVDFLLDGDEFELYREITRFVKRQSARAAATEDPRARAVGFLMALYQRRLASSTRAVRKSLENRARRLERGLKHAQQLARTAPPDLPDWDDLEEMEEEERERLEEMLKAITLASNAAQAREEIAELLELAGQAQEVEDSSAEAKLSTLKDLLQGEGFFDHADRRLLLFTEFKDTLDYLVEKLEAWGFKVGCIHGGMKPGSRDQPGSRLYSEQQFREGEIQILAATEAAGEGINLQCCNILFNYDIPWNPNRVARVSCSARAKPARGLSPWGR